MFGKQRLNKRGDIPIVILVIGVVVICGLAILSFVNPIKKNDKFDVNLFEEIHSDLAKFEFYRMAGYGSDEARKFIGAEFEGMNLVIKKEGDLVEIKYKVPLKPLK